MYSIKCLHICRERESYVFLIKNNLISPGDIKVNLDYFDVTLRK